jgi:hypothetical protein
MQNIECLDTVPEFAYQLRLRLLTYKVKFLVGIAEVAHELAVVADEVCCRCAGDS